MGVNVDESGCYDQAGGIDHCLGFNPVTAKSLNGFDAVVDNADIRSPSRSSAAIDYIPSENQKIKHVRMVIRTNGTALVAGVSQNTMSSCSKNMQTAPMTHRTIEELEEGLEQIRGAPSDNGTLRLIVARTAVDAREIVGRGELTTESGLAGDNWLARGDRHTEDGRADPLRQITIMNSRVLELIAGPTDEWPAAGDQLYADFDISAANAPAGTRLRIGKATVEVTEAPHLGCGKFKVRYGHDALRWVNSETGVNLKLRGINARVIDPGTIRTGDPITKL